MSDQTNSKVLSCGKLDPSADSTTPADEADALRVYRDRLADGVAAAFGKNLGRAQDDLLGMAARATSPEQQQLYVAAADCLTHRGQELLARFRTEYFQQFDKTIASMRFNPPEDASTGISDSCLGAATDFEHDLSIGKLSARAECDCAPQLASLDRRVAALLPLARTSQDDHPLYPRTLFAAMFSALQALRLSDQMTMSILKEFGRHTSTELPVIYQDLDRHLTDSSRLPESPSSFPGPARRHEWLDTSSGQSTGSSDLAPASPPAAGGRRIARADPSRLDQLPAQFPDPVFERLASAVAATAQLPRGTSKAPIEPYLHPEPPIELAQLLVHLTDLQRGAADTWGLPGPASTHLDPACSTVLQQIRTAPMLSRSNPDGALTADIVAKLFTAIFNDADLAATLRAQIARLQVPVLKVALIDKTFFSNKQHPARRLLDLIASAGVGRNVADDPQLSATVQVVVDDVVAGFETDIDIIADQVRRLDDFLQNEEAHARARTTQAVETLAQRGRHEVARTRVHEEIAERLSRPGVPTLVAEFLSQPWRLVLESAYVRDGSEGATWVAAQGAMDDLLWSVRPKCGAHERKRLLTTIPDLLRALRAGLETLDLNDPWDPFFAELIKLHVGALRTHNAAAFDHEPASATPGPPAPSATSTAPIPGRHRGLKTLELVNTPSCIEYHPEPAAAPRQSTQTDDNDLRLTQTLGIGTWVEFEGFRGRRKTLRLNWISLVQGAYLFTNREGENVLTLSRTSLAEHLRRGTARVLSEALLTERAVAQLLEGATQQPAHQCGHSESLPTPSDQGHTHPIAQTS